MKNLIAIACLIVCISACNQASKQAKTVTADTISAGKNSIRYVCPMDADVVQDKPGKCPKCGMELVKK